MTHERQARINHASGCGCEQSVFGCFCAELGVSPVRAMQMAPKRRDRGEQCGAYLSGMAVLERLKPEAVGEYTQRFIEQNGTTVCARLTSGGAHGKSCNNIIGEVVNLVETLL